MQSVKFTDDATGEVLRELRFKRLAYWEAADHLSHHVALLYVMEQKVKAAPKVDESNPSPEDVAKAFDFRKRMAHLECAILGVQIGGILAEPDLSHIKGKDSEKYGFEVYNALHEQGWDHHEIAQLAETAQAYARHISVTGVPSGMPTTAQVKVVADFLPAQPAKPPAAYPSSGPDTAATQTAGKKRTRKKTPRSSRSRSPATASK